MEKNKINIINKEIDKKVEEFFFGPGQNSAEFQRLFFKNNPNYKHVRFSPLYLARRDIYYCLGMNPEDGSKSIKTKTGFGPANFAAIWLIWETLITLAKSTGINDRNKPNQNDFIAKLFKIKLSSVIALRKLRNAITHINYGLHYKDECNVLWQFNLSSIHNVLVRKARKSKYSSNNYKINPIIFHQKFEKGLTSLKEKLQNRRNKKLRESFNNSDPTKRANWTLIYFI